MARRRRAGQQAGGRREVAAREPLGEQPLLQLRDAARHRRRLGLVRGGAQRDLIQRVAALRRQRRQQLQRPLRRRPTPAAVAAATAAAAAAAAASSATAAAATASAGEVRRPTCALDRASFRSELEMLVASVGCAASSF